MYINGGVLAAGAGIVERFIKEKITAGDVQHGQMLQTKWFMTNGLGPSQLDTWHGLCYSTYKLHCSRGGYVDAIAFNARPTRSTLPEVQILTTALCAISSGAYVLCVSYLVKRRVLIFFKRL